MQPPLQRDPLPPLGRRRGDARQLRPLPLEDQLLAGDPGCGEERHGADSALAGRGGERDPAALVVADGGDAVAVGVVAAIPQVAHEVAHVLRVVAQTGRLGTPAALPDAARVVADDQVTRLRERRGELGEDRHPEEGAVAVGGRSAGHEDDGGPAGGGGAAPPPRRPPPPPASSPWPPG